MFRNTSDFVENIAGKISRYQRPYVKDAQTLLKDTGQSTRGEVPIDIDFILKKSKLQNSLSHQANWDFWSGLIEKYELPKYGPNLAIDEKLQRYSSCLLLGVFHYEFLIDIAKFDNDSIYNAAFAYASDLLCPQNIIKDMMMRKTPIEEISETLKAPVECVKYSLAKAINNL